jgi:putative Flp pilus-assembly TadE/G-like protein
MTRLVSRLRRDDGQVLVLVAAIMVGVLGMTAFVVDVGSWFRQQRATQSVVDAAALAGAQALPLDPASALSIAKDYGAKNGGDGELTDADITISTTYRTNDTITVKKTQPAPGFFGRIFGVNFVNVHAQATAMLGVPRDALYVAPIAVNILHPDLKGTPTCPCFGPQYPTTLPLGKTGAPGAFDLLNLDLNDQNGTVGASTMASWINDGYQKYLPLGGYYSDPGAKYNSSNVGAALDARIGTELLFPVYDTLIGTGSNADYHVIAWVGFHLLPGSTFDGSTGSLNGYFTRVIWQGLVPPNGGGSNPPVDLGVGTPVLVN